jgi:hypothetical protein
MPETNPAVPSGGTANAPSAAPSTPAPATSAPASAKSGPSTPSTPAAVQPAPAGAPAPQPPSSGEPPKERWDDILKNARQKTRQEVEQEFQQKYGAYDIFERDPWAAVQAWLDQASDHSIYGPMVQSYIQKRTQAAKPDFGAEPQADLPIVDANGNVTGHTFSDKQLRQWHDWNRKQQEQEWDERFGRVEKLEQDRQTKEEAAQRWQAALTDANTTLTKLRAMPYFKEHESEIRQLLEQNEAWGDNVYAAYTELLTTKILPTLGQAEQQKVIDSLQNKAAGATVAPGAAAPGRPAFKSFGEAARYFAEHPEEAEAMSRRG